MSECKHNSTTDALDAACTLSPADTEDHRIAVALRLATEAPLMRAQMETYQRALAAAVRRAQGAEAETLRLRTEIGNSPDLRTNIDDAVCIKDTLLKMPSEPTTTEVAQHAFRIAEANHAIATDALDKARRDLQMLDDPASKRALEDSDPWVDKPLPEDSAILKAHPMNGGRHDLYMEAMRLVGARHSKHGLVDLVSWLLLRIEKTGPQGKEVW
jgi:hypothetical protein